MRRLAIGGIGFLVLAGLLVLAVRTLDPLNVWYKRLKAADPHVYETVTPALAETDPAQFLTLTDAASVSARRAALTRLIYGALRRLPVPAYRNDGDSAVAAGLRRALIHARTVRRYYMTPRPGVLSFFYLLEPKRPAGKRGVIYHNGFAGTSVQSAALLDALLEAGATVIAIDQLCYGDNACNAPCGPGHPPDCLANLQFGLAKMQTPLRDHVEPVRAAADLLFSRGAAEVDAVGFSAGAGTVTLVAAVDTRIRRSVAAAGVLPYYLREGQDAPIGIADYAPLQEMASMMDLFLLSAAGKGRAHLHLFNRFDRCCFRNVKGRLYEPTLRERLAAIGIGGAFSVAIDETHARHAISGHGVATILSFLGYR